jgi:hypothetical protein
MGKTLSLLLVRRFMELKSKLRGWLGVFMMKDPAAAARYMFLLL